MKNIAEMSIGEISVLEYETGKLSALSPTDCVKDRLAAYYHWNDRECLEQALLVSNNSEIDFTEIERWSCNEGYEADFTCFHSLYRIRIEQQ